LYVWERERHFRRGNRGRLQHDETKNGGKKSAHSVNIFRMLPCGRADAPPTYECKIMKFSRKSPLKASNFSKSRRFSVNLISFNGRDASFRGLGRTKICADEK